MQARKKKVETYDGDLDFFAPAVAQPAAPQVASAAGHVQSDVQYVHAAAPPLQAPAPVTDMPSTVAPPAMMYTKEQQQVPVSYHQHGASPSPRPQEAPSYNTWNAEQPHAPIESHYTDYGFGAPSSNNEISIGEYDQSQLSPIAVPTSLRPISKGIKRSPSAGIISALAAAESMARAGSSTNASASPAPSVSGDKMPSGGLPSMGSIGGGSSSALPFLPAAYAFPNTAATVVPPPEPEYVATSFAVCDAPLFSQADGPSEFDAIADSADALDSFSLDDDTTANGNGGGSTWLPSAQAWQSPVPAAPQPPEQPPSAPQAVPEPEPVASVHSVPPVASHAYQYTASPSPVPPQYEQQDEDFFAQIGDDSGSSEQQQVQEDPSSDAAAHVGIAEGNDIPVAEAPFISEQQQQQIYQEREEDVTSVAAEQPQQQQEEATVVQPEVNNDEHTPGSTWYDDAGYCYYLSEDGWKYFWDNTTQQWSAHEYVGVSGGATASADAVEEVKQDEFTHAELESEPVKEASFSDYAAGGSATPPPAVAVAEEEVEVDSSIADWDTSGQQVETNTQYTYYQQQHYNNHNNHNSFSPQQHSTPLDAHPAPSSAPAPGTFVPSLQQSAHEPLAMHPSPYLQPNITTAAVPTWGATTAAAASPPRQLQSQQHQHQHQHYHHQSPQQYQHQQTSLHLTCGFAKFTFGGRLVRVSPSGTITTHLISALPEDVVRPVGGVGTVSMSSRIEMLNAFPGLLGTTLNKEKAAAFFAARKEACVGEEPGGDAAAIYTLWSVLEAQALHPLQRQQTTHLVLVQGMIQIRIQL